MSSHPSTAAQGNDNGSKNSSRHTPSKRALSGAGVRGAGNVESLTTLPACTVIWDPTVYLHLSSRLFPTTVETSSVWLQNRIRIVLIMVLYKPLSGPRIAITHSPQPTELETIYRIGLAFA
ncbi:hypothetical protein GYMLUDRAFT_246390 [Collybiopsis luxurians FD-317 M1]|uniref:Unplaced genomic scaffold GYMLUscaffold_39, whole genome shotgun sequence n=1 Tax=Collybiopsis luxurians FD-317 M1 TaxID=944289 RepID=A0A0D0CIC1_9AGAR|nr:hypothetical protein GYMLUDRAFT_246390 [Collybiopsis luxurians FD-317 M1]